MQANKKFFALAVALALGVAAAEGTPAGTDIKNTATATYANPADPNGPSLSSTSNEVVTKVLPKPDFDIVFQGNTPTDGGTQNAIGTTTSSTPNTTPGSDVDTPYTVLNNGNVPLTVNLAADTTGAASGQTVEYYLASDLTTPITSVTLPVDDPATPADEGKVEIVQRIKVPATAAPADVFGASPEGTVAGTGTTSTGNGYATGSTNYEEAKPENDDLQFHKVTMFTPGVTTSPNPNSPTNPTNPDGTTATPIPNDPVPVPTLAPGDTDPTKDTPPTEEKPGYPSSGDPTPTPIIPNLNGNIQEAYPKADPDTTPDQVTFTNTVKNTGTTADKVQLFPKEAVNPDGTLKPNYTYDPATATFTQPDGTKVQFLDPKTGQPIPQKDGSLYPEVDVPAGSEVYYQTRITFPDPDDSNTIAPITVEIGVDSLNDAGVSPDATTTNKIYPPAAEFGDSTTPQGADASPTPVQNVDPSKPVGAPLTSPDGTDSTAVFPMDVVNNGAYTDSFKLKGSVDINGTTVPVKYVDATTGAELAKDSNGDYITPVVAPGTEYKALAVIDVPSTAPSGDYTVQQSATGNYSTIPMTDNNDIIRVAVAGQVAVAKFTAKAPTAAGSETENGITNPADFTAQPTEAKPGDTLSYRIIGKNNYNAAADKFALCDVVPLNTTFESVALVPAPTAPAKAIYSADGGATWVATAPAPGSINPTNICVALDANSDNAPDALAAGATLSADFKVKVK